MARPLAMGLLSKKVPKAEDVYNAVKAGNVAEVTKLLGAGGSPEKHEDAFVRRTHRSSAQLVISVRAASSTPRVRPRTQTADVCLHVAANKGRTEILNLLIEHKADVNKQNKACVPPTKRTAHRSHSRSPAPLRIRNAMSPRCHHASRSSARRRCTVRLGTGTTRS